MHDSGVDSNKIYHSMKQSIVIMHENFDKPFAIAQRAIMIPIKGYSPEFPYHLFSTFSPTPGSQAGNFA